MPITLDDDLALLIIRQLTIYSANAPSLMPMVAENQKLLLALHQKVDAMSQSQSTTDQEFQTELAGIQADMAKQTTVTNSVLVFVQGIKQKLADALAQAQAAGATPDELAAIRALHADLNSNTAALVSAATDGTTAAGEAPAPVEPTTTVTDPSNTGTATGSGTGTATVDDGTQQPTT